jgi:hypothetical protein
VADRLCIGLDLVGRVLGRNDAAGARGHDERPGCVRPVQVEGDGQRIDDLDLVTGDLAGLLVEGAEERSRPLGVVDPVVAVE